MKRILTLLLFCLLAVVSTSAAQIRAPKGFAGKLWGGTLALYEQNPAEHPYFVCTTEPYEKIPGGYRLVTAGHCIEDKATYFVADEIGGKFAPVTVIKHRDDKDFDFAILEFKTTKKYPVMKLDSDANLQVGEPTISIHFAEGLSKQFATGDVASRTMVSSLKCTKLCIGFFLAHLVGGPGASGATIVSARTHHILGLVVGEWDDLPGAFGIEPISQLAKFIAEPIPVPVAPLTIPQDIYESTFGPDHTFTLTVHGADPVFVQGGYKFQAVTDGLELDDPYWYDVPVFIGQNADGTFGLVTSKDFYEVRVIILAKVAP
jgi:hypothetical protein